MFRFGGFFAHFWFTAETAPEVAGVELEPESAEVVWTGISHGERVSWPGRVPEERHPDPAPWVASIWRGMEARVGWWAERRVYLMCTRLRLGRFRVHPNGTTHAFCERAGQIAIDQLIERLSSSPHVINE